MKNTGMKSQDLYVALNPTHANISKAAFPSGVCQAALKMRISDKKSHSIQASQSCGF